MHIHRYKLFLLLVLVIAQQVGYAQIIIKDTDSRTYRNKPPRHRLTFDKRAEIIAERLEFAVDGGVGFIIDKAHIDSGRIDPEKTKGKPVPYGSLRVFYNAGPLQFGLGYETGSLAIETQLPVTDAKTGTISQRKGTVYLASPFHTISAYINTRGELNGDYWYLGFAGGYMLGNTRSSIPNDYQASRQLVTGGYFGLLAGYALYRRHIGINFEIGPHFLWLNNRRQASFMPLTIGIRYRNYPGFHNWDWRKKYRPREPAEKSIII